MTIFIDNANEYLEYKKVAKVLVLEGKRKKKITIPCADTIMVNRDMIVANYYNPNQVSDDKMDLLYESITLNGFAFPVMVAWDNDRDLFMVVDGFHRYTISGPKWLDLKYVPIAVLTHDKPMVATWQFNKARGVHQVDLDADLIKALIEQGMEETEIATSLGVDLDTVYRYKQVTGIIELFKNTEYSMPWSVVEVE